MGWLRFPNRLCVCRRWRRKELGFQIRFISNRPCRSRIRLSDGRRFPVPVGFAVELTHLKANCLGIARSFFGYQRLAPLFRPLSPSKTRPKSCLPHPTARLVLHGFPVRVCTQPLGLPELRRVPPNINPVANTPAEPLDARVAPFFQRWRPSPAIRWVDSRISVFEACSAFTACYGLHTRRVALRPLTTPEASEISLPSSLLGLLPTCLSSIRRRRAAATFVGWNCPPREFRGSSRRTGESRLIRSCSFGQIPEATG